MFFALPLPTSFFSFTLQFSTSENVRGERWNLISSEQDWGARYRRFQLLGTPSIHGYVKIILIDRFSSDWSDSNTSKGFTYTRISYSRQFRMKQRVIESNHSPIRLLFFILCSFVIVSSRTQDIELWELENLEKINIISTKVISIFYCKSSLNKYCYCIKRLKKYCNCGVYYYRLPRFSTRRISFSSLPVKNNLSFSWK